MDRRRHSGGDLSSLQHRRGSKVATTFDQEPHGHDTAEPHPRKIHRRHLGRRDPLLLSVRRAPLERPTDPAPCRSRSLPSRPPSTHTPWSGPARHHLTTLPGPWLRARPAESTPVGVRTLAPAGEVSGNPLLYRLDPAYGRRAAGPGVPAGVGDDLDGRRERPHRSSPRHAGAIRRRVPRRRQARARSSGSTTK
jgi:hypothetical protein